MRNPLRDLLRRLLPATDAQWSEAIDLIDDIEIFEPNSWRSYLKYNRSQYAMDRLIRQLREYRERQNRCWI
jgi:hypothetical protein